MRNSDKLSALGVKDDDLLMMVSVSGGGGGARYAFRFILQCTVEKMLRTSIFYLELPHPVYAALQNYDTVGMPAARGLVVLRCKCELIHAGNLGKSQRILRFSVTWL